MLLCLLACAALLGVFAITSFSAIRTKSSTIDEPVHALAGWLNWHYGDYRIDPEDPPLWGYWMALPNGRNVLTVDFESPAWNAIPPGYWTLTPWWSETLYRFDRNDSEALVRRARAMALPIGILLGALIAWWASRLAGVFAAIVAVALFAFDPNFLAHAPLVKNDVAITAVMLAATYMSWRVGKRARWLNVLVPGILCGVGMSVKFSGLLLLPIVISLLFARAMLNEPWPVMRSSFGTRGGRLAFAGGASIATLVMALGVVWASYGFRYAATSISPQPLNLKLQVALAAKAHLIAENPGHAPTAGELAAAPTTPFVRAVIALNDHHLMPEAWLNGLLYTYHTSLIRPSYLLGEVKRTGWWHYFPVAMVCKTPLTTIVLALGAGVIAIVYKGRGRLALWSCICLLIPPAIYFAVALRTNLNLGIRHILPVYPFAFIGIAIALERVRQNHRRVAMVMASIAVVTLATESLAAWPNYIPFFNIAAGGGRGGAHLLGDSNLDWGQDLKTLADWRRQHPQGTLYLHYFGSADPSRELDFIPLQLRRGPGAPLAWPEGPGFVAISVTNLQGIYLAPDVRAFYRPLLDRRPLADLGGTIYVFELPIARSSERPAP
jgi:hypothetical protein